MGRTEWHGCGSRVGKQVKEPLLTPGLDTMLIDDSVGEFFAVCKGDDLVHCQF